MDNKEIRRRNFWALVHPHGYSDDGVRKCSDKTGLSEQRIRHLIKKSPDIKGKNIGDNAARDIERFYSKPTGWLDVAHNENDIQDHNDEQLIDSSKDANKERDGYIEIIQYEEVFGSMGEGLVLPELSGRIKKWTVEHEWARHNLPANTGIGNLRIVTGFGSSMRGMFESGDSILIDTGVKDVKYDHVYFFRIGEEGFIKIISRIPGKGLVAVSKNPDYPSFSITSDMDFEVLGAVLKVWNGNVV